MQLDPSNSWGADRPRAHVPRLLAASGPCHPPCPAGALWLYSAFTIVVAGRVGLASHDIGTW